MRYCWKRDYKKSRAMTCRSEGKRKEVSNEQKKKKALFYLFDCLIYKYLIKYDEYYQS